MKKYLLVLCLAALAGCSSYGENYLEHPGALIRDPHFGQYKENRDDLESAYLHKEITYAEYIERRDKMDAQYAREVKERTDKIISPE